MDRTDESESALDVAETVDELIGETPLVRLDAFADNLFGKLEAGNPYSVKDRIAREMLDAAERAGALEAGGTIAGVSEFVKEEQGKPAFTTVAIEPAESPTLSALSSEGHDIQGIGPGFVPDVLRTELVDETFAVEAAAAKDAARKLGRTEGLLVGISSGAALSAAADYANDHPDELVVAVLPDTGERYLSTDLYEGE